MAVGIRFLLLLLGDGDSFLRDMFCFIVLALIEHSDSMSTFYFLTNFSSRTVLLLFFVWFYDDTSKLCSSSLQSFGMPESDAFQLFSERQ